MRNITACTICKKIFLKKINQPYHFKDSIYLFHEFFLSIVHPKFGRDIYKCDAIEKHNI